MVVSLQISDISDIRKSVDRILYDVGRLSEERSFYVRFIANELLTNTVKYAEESVLLYKVEDHTLVIGVLGGSGFDVQQYFGYTPCIAAESGRGIFLVESLATRLRYNRRGNAVVAHIELKGKES